MVDVVSVIVTFDGNLMQDMLPIGSQKYQLVLAMEAARSELNIVTHEIGRILGLLLALDEEPKAIGIGVLTTYSPLGRVVSFTTKSNGTLALTFRVEPF